MNGMVEDEYIYVFLINIEDMYIVGILYVFCLE